MIKNYLKSALRNITRNKFYSVLNILGLSIGLISTIFILLYIQDELSFDKYNKNYKRIYRLESDFRISEKHDKFAVTSVPIAPAMKMEYPEIENMPALWIMVICLSGIKTRSFMKRKSIQPIPRILKCLPVNF